jgi:hypothetical protein
LRIESGGKTGVFQVDKALKPQTRKKQTLHRLNKVRVAIKLQITRQARINNTTENGNRNPNESDRTRPTASEIKGIRSGRSLSTGHLLQNTNSKRDHKKAGSE